MQMKIQNSEGESLKSISSVQEIGFNNPIIIFDTLKPSIKTPEIKIIQSPFDLKELIDLGICMYSSNVLKSKTWSPRQKLRYYLRFSDLPSDSDSKEVKKLPANHILENDIANDRIRLVGRFISPNSNKSEWFRY